MLRCRLFANTTARNILSLKIYPIQSFNHHIPQFQSFNFCKPSDKEKTSKNIANPINTLSNILSQLHVASKNTIDSKPGKQRPQKVETDFSRKATSTNKSTEHSSAYKVSSIIPQIAEPDISKEPWFASEYENDLQHQQQQPLPKEATDMKQLEQRIEKQYDNKYTHAKDNIRNDPAFNFSVSDKQTAIPSKIQTKDDSNIQVSRKAVAHGEYHKRGTVLVKQLMQAPNIDSIDDILPTTLIAHFTTEIMDENIVNIDKNTMKIVSEWIFNEIKNDKNNELPFAEDICMKFPLLSIQQSLDIRLSLVEYLIENIEIALNYFDNGQFGGNKGEYISSHMNRFEDMSEMNYFNRVGDQSSSFNVRETDMSRDPFDSYSFSNSAFEGMVDFDPAFHKMNINTTRMSPHSWYGYNNKVSDTYFDTHEVVQEVDSEHGKFRMLLLNPNMDDFGNNENQFLSFGIMEDIRRKMHRINKDSKTVAYGITSRDRKQFIGDIDHDFLLHSFFDCNIKEIGALYVSKYLQMMDEFIHSNKPLFIGTSSHLTCLQSIALLHGSARMADASTRLSFNHMRYGMIPFGGYSYRMCLSSYKSSMYYSLLSGQPLAAWDAYEIGCLDWIMPSSNSVLAFNHMSLEIDSVFSSYSTFLEQDRFRNRAMLKNVIELFDRGLEYYRASVSESFFATELKEVFLENEKFRDLENIQLLNEVACEGNANFQTNHVIIQEIVSNDSGIDIDAQIKNSIFRARQMSKNMSECSPIALALNHCLMVGVQKEFNELFVQSNTLMTGGREVNVSQWLHKIFTYEYHIMCWLMFYGDFWEGLKRKQNEKYIPQWKFSSVNKMFESGSECELMRDLKTNGLQSVIFTELPYSWMENQLVFKNDDEMYDDFVFPRVNSLYNDGRWDNSYTVNNDVVKKMIDPQWYLHDWTMLRGSCPPNIELLLNKNYGQNWRLSRLYQGRELYASQPTKEMLMKHLNMKISSNE